MEILSKKCPRCKVRKLAAEFYKTRNPRHKNKYYLSNYCKVCVREVGKSYKSQDKYKAAQRRSFAAWLENLPKKDRLCLERAAKDDGLPINTLKAQKRYYLWQSSLAREYSITPIKWYAMFDAQNGKCGICKLLAKNGGGRRLCVDHDHACCPGKRSCGQCVRGLLCSSCNQKVQFYEDYREEIMHWLR